MYWHSRLCVALVLSSHSEHQALAGIPRDFAPADVGVRRRQDSATGGSPDRRAQPWKLPIGLPPYWPLMHLSGKLKKKEKEEEHKDSSSAEGLERCSLLRPAVWTRPHKSPSRDKFYQRALELNGQSGYNLCYIFINFTQ